MGWRGRHKRRNANGPTGQTLALERGESQHRLALVHIQAAGVVPAERLGHPLCFGHVLGRLRRRWAIHWFLVWTMTGGLAKAWVCLCGHFAGDCGKRTIFRGNEVVIVILAPHQLDLRRAGLGDGTRFGGSTTPAPTCMCLHSRSSRRWRLGTVLRTKQESEYVRGPFASVPPTRCH
jgi:hypothetical protein